MSSIHFAKHVSFEHSVSSPRPVITSRREEKKKNTKAKVFQHPIDSQSASCSLIRRQSCCLHVLSELGRGAASFLATESTGTVLIPRLMTRIAGHAITPQVDASMAGLGAVLFQEDRPVAFASRALTETESRHANIEREMLAVVFGFE